MVIRADEQGTLRYIGVPSQCDDARRIREVLGKSIDAKPWAMIFAWADCRGNRSTEWKGVARWCCTSRVEEMKGWVLFGGWAVEAGDRRQAEVVRYTMSSRAGAVVVVVLVCGR